MDSMAQVRATHERMAQEAGGTASLKGRETVLCYFIQEWLANEVTMGTNPVEAVDAMLYAFAFNMAGASLNLSRIVDETTDEVLERLEDVIHRNAREMTSCELGSPLAVIRPASKQ